MSDAYESDREQNAVGWPNPYDGDELEPITDALGQDALQAALADAHRMQERLRATRDSRAIAASNANSRMLLGALKGAL